MNTKLDYPNCEILLGAYFNQDWMSESPDPAEIIRSFRRNEPTNVVQGAVDEILRVLTSQPTDAELSQLIEKLGGCLSFAQLGVTPYAWLSKAVELLRGAQSE